MQRHRVWYLTWILLIIWGALTAHIVWGYISFSSEESPGKGWTVIEATTQPIGYLPYLSLSDNDKFYQSLLFKSCLFPTFSGSSISYYEELCSVTTTDYKTFEVSALPGNSRSDGTAFNLGDVFFTYSALLRDNYRTIPGLDSYKNISVIVVDNKIKVTFPQASTDNMIFFTNFILPQHVLANKTRDQYVQLFAENPVWTSCVRLKPTTHDSSSVVFDFASCADTPIKYYQVKQFASTDELSEYTEQHKDDISFVTADEAISGFVANPVILNTYATVFFNTQQAGLTKNLRKKLASRIYTALEPVYSEWTGDQWYIVPDTFLFPRIQTDPLTSGDFTTSSTTTTTTQPAAPASLSTLPPTLTFGATKDTQSYILSEKITDKLPIQITFATKYDKVSIAHNTSQEYFPESYNAVTASTYYNLNPLFRNVIQGLNTYTIRAYQQGKVVDTYIFEVHYLSAAPTATAPAATPTTTIAPKKNIKIIYWGDALSAALARDLEAAAAASGLDQYMDFAQFTDPAAFEGKLQSKDYDLVITPIAMGLRKDMSNLFLSEDTSLNPSQFTNINLAERINAYFLTDDATKRQNIKKNISDLYQEFVPLVILGKEKGVFLVNESLQFSFPFRLYARWRRKDFIKDLSVFSARTVNRSRVTSGSNMIDFLRQNSWLQF